MLPTPTLTGSIMARPRKPAIELPPDVNAVRVKGRPYYYYHPGRGTKNAAKAVRLLPDDPREPEFLIAYRKAAGEPDARTNLKSFASLIEDYRKSPEFGDLADSTKCEYERYLKAIIETWGSLSVDGLLPAHVLALRDRHRDTPAAANAMVRVLSVLIFLERAARLSSR